MTLLTMPGLTPSWAQPQGAAEPSLLVDGVVELDIWSPVTPERRQKHVCTLAGDALRCPMQSQVGPTSVSGEMKGTLRGSKIDGDTTVTMVTQGADCSHSYVSSSAVSIALAPDGTLISRLTNGGAKLLSASGSCASSLPRTTTSPDATLVGTWRQPNAAPGLIAVPQPGAAGGKGGVRLVGTTIYVTDESGKQRVLTIVTPAKAPAPIFSAPTVSGEAKAVERYVVTRVFEASYGNLPADQRAAFVAGMAMPSDVTGEAAIAAAQATLDAGEGAVNWVKNNPADASLLGLSVAVSLAFPISAFANPAVATGGAALLRGVIGGAMVAGTTGFVSSLTGSFISDKSAMQRVKEAAAKGAGDAAASVLGSLASAGFEAVVGHGLAKAAVTTGSVAVGIAVDKVVEKAQISQAAADALLKAPSFVASLVKPPDGPSEPGGISLNSNR